MRILYISASTVPARTANSVHVMKMCEAMTMLGHEVRLLTLKRPEHEDAAVEDVFEYYGVERCFEVQKKPFPGIPGRQFVYSVAAWREARQWKPDLIYGRYFPAMTVLGVAGWPVVWESHEKVWERSRISRQLAKRLFKARGFCKLIVISEALKRMFILEDLLDGDRIMVAHDAADPGVVKTNEKPAGVFEAGYIGGIYPGRGIEQILECASRLEDVEFHFVGGTVEDLREKLGIGNPSKNVVCHGYQPPERIPKLRAGFDVLLAPYQRKVAVWGGNGDTSAFMSPLKIFEYMASGRPMICSDLPVLREVLNDENAILVSPDDVDAWVKAIERLRDNSSLGTKLAAAALSDFEANYTWDIRAERILAACSQD